MISSTMASNNVCLLIVCHILLIWGGNRLTKLSMSFKVSEEDASAFVEKEEFDDSQLFELMHTYIY